MDKGRGFRDTCMKKVFIIILLFSSVCFGDVLDSHLTPRTDSTLDLGSVALLWRFIYGDAFTDGTALWLSLIHI